MDIRRIAVSSDETVWISPTVAPWTLLRLGQGEVRSLTRRGDGPEEFMRIWALRSDAGDTLHVLGNTKMSLFAPNGDFLRSRRVPFVVPQGMTLLADGSYVILGAAQGATLPIHIFSADGVELRTFAPPDWSGDSPTRGPWIVAASNEQRAFWVADHNRYQVHLMNVDGTRRRTLTREVDWFPEWTEEWQPPYQEPPLPRLYAVQEDHLGRLWTMISVADSDFQPIPRLSDEHGPNAPTGSDHPSFDTVIEVLDGRTGEPIASRRFAALLVEFLPRQRLAIPEIEPDGDQAFQIVQLAVP
jgi:hypothetical protein